MLSYAKISELKWIAKHGPSCDQSIPLSDTMRLWRDLVSSCAAACLFPPRGKLRKSIGKRLDWDWSKAQKHFPRCALFWVCDSLWQFVTVFDSLWQFVTVWWFHVHCIVTRITRIVYDISVWFIYDIFMSIFPFLPVSSGYLPSFVEESEEKDVLAQLSFDQLLKDDTESVATKSTDMWHEHSNCQVNGL